MKLLPFVFSLFCVGQSLVAEPVLPKKDLTNKKINIKSQDGMVLATESQKASFKGNVVITMDTLLMKCQLLNVEYEEIKGKRTLKSMHGEGQVYCEETAKKIKAWCDRLDYDHKTEVINVSSDKLSKVIKDDQTFEAESFKIFLQTGELKVDKSSVLEIRLD